MSKKSLAFLSLFCVSAWASADITQQIQSLNDQGRFNEAYQLAESELEALEGEPAFDMQYGIAAIDSGQVSEGVFALERVTFLEPNNALAKLELARGYFLLGQFTKSKALFKKVQETQPPAPVQARIQQYLAQIEKKTTVPPTKFSGFAEFWAGYDSNINSGPDGPMAFLSDDALGRGDQYNQVRLHGSVEHAYSPTNSLLFTANADLRYYHTEPEQDYRNLTLAGKHLWKLDDQQYYLGATVQDYQLDKQAYRTLVGVNGGWSKQLSRNSVLKTFAGINSLSYDQSSWKNSTQINAGANYLYAGSGGWQPLYFVGGFIGDESPEVKDVLSEALVDRYFYGGNIGVQLTPMADLTVTPILTYQASRYEGDSWFLERKKDDLYILNLNMEWVMQKSWTLLANYSYTDADSNIEIYDYERQQIMLGLRYNFN